MGVAVGQNVCPLDGLVKIAKNVIHNDDAPRCVVWTGGVFKEGCSD